MNGKGSGRRVLVSDDELAATYDSLADPVGRVQEYERVQRYQANHPDAGSQAAATALDLNRNRIRPWFDGSRPDPVRAIETASDHGWLDLDYDSPAFAGLNVLCAWIYAGGSISTDTYAPRWALDRPLDGLLAQACELADVDYTLVRDDDTHRGREAQAAADGVVLGRVLSVLGAPAGAKAADRSLSLPDYLEDAPYLVKLDFARTYVLLRGVQIERETSPLQIMEDRSPGYHKSLRALFSDVAGPDTVLGGEHKLLLRPRAAALLLAWPTFGQLEPSTSSWLWQVAGAARRWTPQGLTLTQAIDYYAVEEAGWTQSEWARTRGVSPQTVHERLQECYETLADE